VRIIFRGVRGSVASPRRETSRYGGNTASVEVRAADGCLLILDAGTGIRTVNGTVAGVHRIDVLLTHLHMDHIVGLGFFKAFHQPGLEVHLWGPPSVTHSLHARLTRYLSPPLFPVRLRDLRCSLELHDTPRGGFELPGVTAYSDFVCHPGPTLGYRLETDDGVLAYLSDHEPALGTRTFPGPARWTSGFDIARGADVLIHDAQYTDQEYADHVGWGHSALGHAMALAELAGVRRLVGFHHDPDHDDDTLDQLYASARSARALPYELVAAVEGQEIMLSSARTGERLAELR
jgi:phosphoribosyl 1,2-cyclic phosphodiesterase